MLLEFDTKYSGISEAGSPQSADSEKNVKSATTLGMLTEQLEEVETSESSAFLCENLW